MHVIDVWRWWLSHCATERLTNSPNGTEPTWNSLYGLKLFSRKQHQVIDVVKYAEPLRRSYHRSLRSYNYAVFDI